MSQPRKCTAIKALFALALWCVAAFALAAQVAGTVINVSGPLMAKKADGSVKFLTLRSEVESGDTLVSEKNTYARIKFVDDSEITLKPGTQFTIENFAYDEGKPDNDSAVFNLVKGGLRSVTGALGKRNKDKFGLKTPTATIGIRGTTFLAQYVPPLLPSGPTGRQPGSTTGALAPGLYVSVIDGAINLSNKGGASNFAAGQFGFVSNPTTPPIIVPPNPAVQFMPPPAFNVSVAPGANQQAGKSGNVDCEVR